MVIMAVFSIAICTFFELLFCLKKHHNSTINLDISNIYGKS